MEAVVGDLVWALLEQSFQVSPKDAPF